jgi:hypothetical protein
MNCLSSTYYPITGDIAAKAEASACWMALERDQMRADLGKRPLTDNERRDWRNGDKPGRMPDGSLNYGDFVWRSPDPAREATTRDPKTVTGRPRYLGDRDMSYQHFRLLDKGRGYDNVVSPDGLTFWDLQRLKQYEFEGMFRTQRAEDLETVHALLAAGSPIANAAEVSRSLVTQPIQTAVVASATENLARTGQFTPGQQAPAVIHSDDPIVNLAASMGLKLTTGATVSANVLAAQNLPPGAANRPSALQAAQIEARLAGITVQPGFVGRTTSSFERTQAELKDLKFWQANHGSIVINPAKNPGIPAALLLKPWPAALSAAGHLPPLVFVTFTPKKKPLPDTGFFSANPWVKTIISLIPVVGQIAAPVISVVTMAQQQGARGAIEIPESMFEPQYYPKASDFMLPIDEAQFLLVKPEYINKVIPAFYKKLKPAETALLLAAYNRGLIR